MRAQQHTIEVPIAGMDCTECTQQVRAAIAALPGVTAVDVFLAAEKAIIQLDPLRVTLPAIQQAVAGAGYAVPAPPPPVTPGARRDVTRTVLTLFGVVFSAVLFIVVVGEGLGLFADLTARVPWPLGVLVVGVAGYPVFRNVVRATLRRQVLAHTLMSVGVLAALVVGQWATAVVVVFFMRVGDYAERFTTERARRAVKDLTALAPRTAWVEQAGTEQEVPIAAVRIGDIVVVRPGEQIPVDGVVVTGRATVDQATITGESLPVEVGPAARVFATTIPRLGSLRVRTTHSGPDTTFGRVIKLVEQAEAHRADVQRIADRFAAYYLPVVAGIAALTFLLRRDPLATAAVLVVACSCSFALATPIALLASVGAAAKRGLLIKGGKYLETLARADVLLVDKTGTLTLGRPQITDVVPFGSWAEVDLLTLAAGAERYSEHPLAEAVRAAARERAIALPAAQDFSAMPGQGVRARVNDQVVSVGRRGLVERAPVPEVAALEAQGKTLLFVAVDGVLAGVLAAADTLRPEIPAALAAVQALGIRQIELLTGDNEPTAAALATRLGIGYRANLLPEDKITIVRAYQAAGRIVVMVGDGVNDAPALAQANVGIAMGAAGTAVAVEAAHIVLLREDWRLVPEAFQIARRTMGVIRANLAFTVVYNVVGLTLAALGFCRRSSPPPPNRCPTWASWRTPPASCGKRGRAPAIGGTAKLHAESRALSLEEDRCMADEHAHTHNRTGRKLRLAFALTAIILVVEVAGGLLSNSLALLSDAGHVLTDIVAIGLAWFATVQAERPADARRTYGYHRTGILTALANAITLILIVGVIAYEAFDRLQHPPEVNPLLMFVSATVGIVVNLYIGFGFRAESSDNLNVRAAMLHVFGDVGASVGVIVGGLVILLTGWQLADPLISLGIALLIAKSAWDILRETVDILMEAAPTNLDMPRLVGDMRQVAGVNDVHDLHVWSIAGGMPCLSAHVQVDVDRPLSACDTVLAELNQVLQARYKIQHTTLQLEWAGCEPSDLYCTITADGEVAGAPAAAGHGHTHAADPAPDDLGTARNGPH